MRLLFARHGESLANIRRVIANRDSDHPLTDTGRQQAAALAIAVRPLGIRRVIASPIRRAMETAEIVGHALGLPVETSDALREFDCGDFEGRGDDAAWAAHTAIVREWLELGQAEARLPGGESLVEIRARFAALLRSVIGDLLDADDDPGDTPPRAVLLVSHGGLLRCVLPAPFDAVDGARAPARYLGHTELISTDVRPDGTLGPGILVGRAPA